MFLRLFSGSMCLLDLFSEAQGTRTKLQLLSFSSVVILPFVHILQNQQDKYFLLRLTAFISLQSSPFEICSLQQESSLLLQHSWSQQ